MLHRGLSLVLLSLGLFLQPIPLAWTGEPDSKSQEVLQEISAESEKLEQYLAENGAIYKDPALAAYLEEITGPFFEKIRADHPERKPCLKIIRNPAVNAFALPNGCIYLHLGALARTRRVEELLMIVVHEMGHVFHEDGLHHTLHARGKMTQYRIVDLLLTAPGAYVGDFGLSANLTGLVFAASVQGYSRELESNADLFAWEGLQTAGYDLEKGVGIFDTMMADEERYSKGERVYFLSNHPSNVLRRQSALDWIKAHSRSPETPLRLDDPKRFLDRMEPVRLETAELNAGLGLHFHALDILSQMTADGQQSARAETLTGKIYMQILRHLYEMTREMREEEWIKFTEAYSEEEMNEIALASFEEALRKDPAYAPAYKGLGEWYFRAEKPDEAKRAFEKYLELAPQARDRRSVQRFLKDIQKAAETSTKKS